jgi:hypothetical protein
MKCSSGAFGDYLANAVPCPQFHNEENNVHTYNAIMKMVAAPTQVLLIGSFIILKEVGGKY